MTQKIPYIFDRRGVAHFRRRVPHSLVTIAGCREWKLALGSAQSDPSRLALEIRALTIATDLEIDRLHSGHQPRPELLKSAISSLYPERAPNTFPSVTEAAEIYRKARRLSALAKPEHMAVRQWLAEIGDQQLDKISRSQVRRWVEHLTDDRNQSGSTVRRRVGSMSAIIGVATDRLDLVLVNPFTRLRISQASSGYREPFTQAHLLQISDWLHSGAEARHSGRIIRLLRLTGARPLEIGGLGSADIELDAQIPHLRIRPNEFRGTKTVASRRLIPLVGDAIDAALEAKSAAGGANLFPATCHQTGSLSARLNKAIRSSGIPKSNRLTAYSFRHTVQENLRVMGVPFDVQQAILGHAKLSMTERYGAKHVSLGRMQEALTIIAPIISRRPQRK
jgi:integrase